ncbi:unnamed protein product [Diplocarpon coronariae]
MPTTIELDKRKPTTSESALNKGPNIISKAAYREVPKVLYNSLYEQRETIQALVKHHSRLSDRNTCILAKASYPGTIDEKLSSEVGTYAWMQHYCLDVRIPYLYGFGFSDHPHYINFDTGQMRSVTQQKYRVPQSRVEIFRSNANGTIWLANRPLPCAAIILENAGAPRAIPRNETYTYSKPFIAYMLNFLENSYLSNPNDAITSLHDWERSSGPYLIQFTDFHQSNIFNLPKFEAFQREFMEIIEAKEVRMISKQMPLLASFMKWSWETGGVWFW